jgi:hypothetical protein
MDDRDYFSRRANEERQAADDAACSQARDAHLKMADKYDQLASLRASGVARLLASQSE